MHNSITPIEKHKSQIEKRISMLEQKFRERDIPRDYSKKIKNVNQDENAIINNIGVIGGKSVEVRGKIINQGEPYRVKKQPNYYPIHLNENENQSQQIKDISKTRPIQMEHNQKISELYQMMRSIMQGQKNIQKQLSQLKQQKTKEQTKEIIQMGRPANLIQQNYIPNDSSVQNVRFSQDKIVEKNHRKKIIPNQSLLLQQQQIQTRELKPIKNKNKKKCEFQDLFQQMKEKNRQGQRICVGQQWKQRIWQQVESRVKQSEKEYKDTIHRNNKHQFEHLMSTFQLQRKLKDDLINKAYQQCNHQIYK